MPRLIRSVLIFGRFSGRCDARRSRVPTNSTSGRNFFDCIKSRGHPAANSNVMRQSHCSFNFFRTWFGSSPRNGLELLTDLLTMYSRHLNGESGYRYLCLK
jgi:hypothetical protein